MKIQFATCALAWLLCDFVQADIIHVPAEQPDIQTAINVAVNGDEIIVAPGTYLETINFLGKAITVRSVEPTDLWYVYNTIIEGGGAGSVVTCNSGEGLNSVLNGITISGGTGTAAENEWMLGGGMYNVSSSPTVANCRFTKNAASVGGGMYNSNSSPTVYNCMFIGNLVAAGPRVTLGSGMFNNESSPLVTNCIFIGNSGHFGSGVYNQWGNLGESPIISNCLFIGNMALHHGGGMFNRASNPIVTNCTFSLNTASMDGGGISGTDWAQPMVVNCILWNDSPNEIFNALGGSPIITYSNVQGGYAGIGNINADPRFLDIFVENYRLRASSPCIDAGNSSAVPAGLTTDMDGKPRFVNDPFTPDTGSGPGPVVDMGAFEFIPQCTVDANSDGVVNVSDLLLLLASWGACPFPCLTDANGDGIVDVFDLLTLLAGWGVCG